MSAEALAVALHAFQQRAGMPIRALLAEQGRAAALVEHARDLVAAFEEAVSHTEHPHFDTNPVTQSRLANLYLLALQKFGEMLPQEQWYLDESRDHAHMLAQLEEGAATLLQRARAIVPDPQALRAERREISSTLSEIKMLSLINPGDPNMASARAEWNARDLALRPREFLQTLVEAFEPFADQVARLTQLAQLQRGTWLNIGQDLAIAMAPMGDGGPQAQRRWTQSRVDARIQLASIRRVAERAAAYVAASEPQGFMTA